MSKKSTRGVDVSKKCRYYSLSQVQEAVFVVGGALLPKMQENIKRFRQKGEGEGSEGWEAVLAW